MVYFRMHNCTLALQIERISNSMKPTAIATAMVAPTKPASWRRISSLSTASLSGKIAFIWLPPLQFTLPICNQTAQWRICGLWSRTCPTVGSTRTVPLPLDLTGCSISQWAAPVTPATSRTRKTPPSRSGCWFNRSAGRFAADF